MTKPQEFTIQVQSEDPKKKEKPLNDKPDLASSSKPLRDAKDGDGEELVRIHTMHILIKIYHNIIVRGGPATKGPARNAGRAIEGLIAIYLLCSTKHSILLTGVKY
jgi:hypothetical protein